MNRVVHFDIPVDDPARAIKFYQAVFSWKIDKWPGPVDYWLVTTGPDDQPGINGGMGRRREPSEQVSNTIEVASLKDAEAKIVAAGGRVLASRMPINGVGWLSACLDTEGNKFGLMENDPNAK
jgi:predicted enzyme related to lactoylglutathione lyase